MHMKKTYKIPVIYEMAGDYEIEAESLEEAVNVALYEKPLPENAEYLSDSIFVDKEGVSLDNNLSKEDKKYLNTLTEPFRFG